LDVKSIPDFMASLREIKGKERISLLKAIRISAMGQGK
jgi:hypothetical protein